MSAHTQTVCKYGLVLTHERYRERELTIDLWFKTLINSAILLLSQFTINL